MRSSYGAINNRLARYSRRRRLLLVSYDSAACPSLDDEHFDEQILLDPEILKSINASAEALNMRSFSNSSLRGAASNLVSGSATGSALLADFPEVECEFAPSITEKVAPPTTSDPTSVFDDHIAPQSDAQAKADSPIRKESVEASSPAKKRFSKWNLAEYLNQSPTGTTQGMQQIRSWLHHQQPRVWMFLGDETTAWLRHSGQPGFAEMFRHRLRWELRRFPDLIVNAGVKNASLDEIWKIARQGLTQCHPDVAFILPGKADALEASQSPHRYAEKLKELAEFLRINGSEPVFQTPPLPELLFDNNLDDPMRTLCDLIREVAVVNNIPLIDHAEFWQEQTTQPNWVNLRHKTIAQAGQSVLALLFFAELDIFDRSSELCGKLQDAWSNAPETEPIRNPASSPASAS